MPSNHPQAIRILIVDDHPVVRAGLTSMLRSYPFLEVAGSASDGRQMFALLEKSAVDVVLLDLRMPGMSGVEILEALKAAANPVRVIVLTSSESDESIYTGLRAGASGCWLKVCSEEQMIEAIRVVHEGGRYLPQDVAARFAARMPRAPLNAQQAQIFDAIASGRSDHQVSRELGISLAALWQSIGSSIALLDGWESSTGEAKGRRPTMADIARKAGVSLATVSRVLHHKGLHTEETRHAVMKAVQECNFQRNDTAASLASMRSAPQDD